jgi:hypothetical protein
MAASRTMYEDRVLKLVELVDSAGRLENAAFIGCQMNGPGVFFPERCTFSNSSFDTPDVEAIIWEVPEGAFKIGAMHIVNCEFEKCRFSGLGIAAPPPMADQLRTSLPKQ